jgi:hypothetical protein
MFKFLTHWFEAIILSNTLQIGRGIARVSKVTPKEQLKDFFEMIKPVKTNFDLIRVGAAGDGGYLVPNDLDGIDACFSPGVSTVADFEVALANRGIKCFLADYSVEAPPVSHPLFDFEKKYLGPKSTDMYQTLNDWIAKKSLSTGDLILQMDIEGAEYGVLLETSSELLKKFRIVVIEFHDLDSLYDKMGFDLLNHVFSKILRDFEVVHIHPNNCRTATRCYDYEIPPAMEFTFIRKDRVTHKTYAVDFPHALDAKNMSQYKDIPLPKCWHH